MRTQLIGCLALALAGAAAADIQVKGTLDGESLDGSVRRVQLDDGSYAIEATLSNGMTGRGTRIGAGLYRITFPAPRQTGRTARPATVGLSRALLGETGPAGGGETSAPAEGQVSMLLTNTGRELTAIVYRDGKPVGSVSAERREAPERERRQTRRGVRVSKAPQYDELGEEIPVERDSLLREKPVFSQVVQVAGVGQAMWDFYKPGSRRLEELRGYSTGDQTDAMREVMDTIPGPWTAEQIYRVARGMEDSDRTALELAFGFMVDQRNVPLKQFPGIESNDIHDKYEHFFASAIMAHRGNADGSFTVGWLKEVVDEVSGSGYSEEDLIADALGAEFGQELLKGKVTR